jgi:hypothetical protein
MKINTAFKVIMATYLLAELLLLLFAGAYFLVIPNVADWEMFAYNFYGSIVISGLSCLIGLVLRFTFKIDNKITLCVLLFILPELLDGL